MLSTISTAIYHATKGKHLSYEDKKPAPLEISLTPTRPIQHVATDVVRPLLITKRGNTFLLRFQDIFTKYPEAFPIPNQTVNTISITFINHIICRHGCPESLNSDLGSNFTSELFT